MRFPTSPCIHYFSKHHVWSSFLSHNCHAQTIIVAPGTSSGWTDRPDHPTLADLRSCQSTSASQKLLEPEGQGTDHGRPSTAPKGTDSQTQDAKYPPAIRAVGCLFSQTPPLLLPAGAGINLLRYCTGAWRQSSGKGGGVGADEGEGFFFSLCKHPVSPLTSLTDGNQLKAKKPCL